jgi:predicted O-methyltransferase YrrM
MRNLQELRKAFTTYKILPIEWLGDSPTRFDDYTRYASGCRSILELGTYTGLATTALLLAKPQKMVTIDVSDHNLTILDELILAASKQNTLFEFIKISDLEFRSDDYELLFIDTTHTYEQTVQELEIFGKNANKIVLHDIASFPGVHRAVFEWLYRNKQFFILEHDNRGDGIIVLQKYPGT